MHSHVNFVDKSILWQVRPVDNFWLSDRRRRQQKSRGQAPAFPDSI